MWGRGTVWVLVWGERAVCGSGGGLLGYRREGAKELAWRTIEWWATQRYNTFSDIMLARLAKLLWPSLLLLM